MAATNAPRKPKNDSVSRIVIYGVLTGGVAWLPLLWFDPVPEQTVSNPSPIAAVTPPSQKAAVAIDHPVTESRNLFDNRFGSLPGSWPTATPRRSDQPEDQSEDSKVASSSSTDSIENSAAASQARPAAISTGADDEAVEISNSEAAPQTRTASEPVSTSSNHPKKPSSNAAIRQPQRVVAANFEEPLTVAPAGTDDETSTVQRMHELNDADPEVAERATQELSSRGFTEAHLRLARQLTSPDPSHRAELAAQLPGAAGIDARLWLTWLLRDEATDVRLSALSVLATSTDPDTVRRITEIARQDRDPRVRQQVEQLEKMRRGAR
jgi:hypothetical protein